MNGHTAGNWEFTYDGDVEPPSAIYSGDPGDETFIANLCGGLPPLETFANARLIAAAPSLLSACRELVFRFAHAAESSPEDAEAIALAVAAINKATDGVSA